MKPLIGIVEWPYFDKDQDKVYEIMIPIVEWIVRSGGRPIGVFPSNVDDFLDKRNPELKELGEVELADLKETISLCDGIIKPGALRIYPHESKIYEYAYNENVPYLGICQGMQLMRNHNIEYTPNVKNDSDVIHHSKDTYIHSVNIVPNTRLHSILNKDEIMVNSRHNYHIPDSGLKQIGAYAIDNVIESIEDKDKLFNIGVQWHPELLPIDDENSINLFGEFIESAKVYKKRR